MPVIDFSDFPEPNTEDFLWLPEDEFEQYEIYCDYIQLATTVPSGTKIESGFYCRKEMPDGELCDGTIEVSQIDQPHQVRWVCRKCTDMGAIINYEGSVWDNSRLTEKEQEIFMEDFFSGMTGEDVFEDEFYDLYEDETVDLFDNFEYYVNPYDPEGETSGVPGTGLIEEILTCNWKNPESPIYLNDDLSLPELEKSYFFYNARRFLLTLQQEGSFTLTRTGNLKRKVVRQLLEQTRWPDDYIESISRYQKHLDETDVWLLHGIRVLLDLAGLTRWDDDEIRINEETLHLLDKENAGHLYRILFSTYFKEMNLGYLGSTFELPHLQYSVPFILYQLPGLAKDWVSIEELHPEILLYSVRLELQFEDLDNSSIAHELLLDDLFTALDRFGLVEIRGAERSDSDMAISHPYQIRITPMYEKFIQTS